METPPSPLRNLCVFCGSKLGSKPEYEGAAIALGKEMLRRGVGLVYGGGDVGLSAFPPSCQSRLSRSHSCSGRSVSHSA
jgi:hypothetical protein